MTTTAHKPKRQGRDWCCHRCREVLGHVTGMGDLVITMPGATIERTRLAVVIRCRCGVSKAFSGRRVMIDVPAKVA